MTLEQKLAQATEYLKLVLVNLAPKDTGNLAFNSIRMSQISPSHYQIIIGGEIAPYAVYTNTKNKSSKGWVETAIDIATPIITLIMSGAISEEELALTMANQLNMQGETLMNMQKEAGGRFNAS